MNILVTGANGFLGRALCDYISHHGLGSYGLLRAPEEDLNVKKQFIVKNFLSHSDWGSILKSMDVVIHTAGLAHVKNLPPKDYYETNTEISKELALECIKAGVKRFVYISSIAVYGISSSREIINLSTPLNPTTPYAHSKLLAEIFLQKLHQEGKLDVVIIRPPLIYGANASGNIEFLLKSIKRNFPLPFYGVKNLRSMIYIKNLCDCLLNCVINPKSCGQVFLVSDSMDISTPNVIKFLAKGLNKHPKLFPFPLTILHLLLSLFKKEEVLGKITGSLRLDISHIRKTLGWEPPFSALEGLKKTAQHMNYP